MLTTREPSASQMQQPLLGQVGLYEIDTEIGRSSSAAVYRALNTSLQYSVALKVLRSGFAHNRAVSRYFIAEGQDGMRLIHPNIVRVYDAGQNDGVAFIAQSLVAGVTLAQQLERQVKPFSLEEAIPLLEEIAKGLEYAHGQGHVHANLKPSNIFLTQRGRVLISDFRVANPAGILRPPDFPMGTPAYFSPEQQRSELILTTATDIYALGLIAFQMLTGQLPYSSDDSTYASPQVHAGMLTALRRTDVAVRRELVLIFNRTFSANASERFPSASALVQAMAGATQQRLETLHLFNSTNSVKSENGHGDVGANGFGREGFKTNGVHSAPDHSSVANHQDAPAVHRRQSVAQSDMTTALVLHRPAALVLASSMPKLLPRLTKVQKQEQRDLSWFALGAGVILMSMIVLGVMNTTTHLLAAETFTRPDALEPAVASSLLYIWLTTLAGWLRALHIIDFISPFPGLIVSGVLVALLFQKEFLRDYAGPQRARWWRILNYSIPPLTILFFALLTLQILALL